MTADFKGEMGKLADFFSKEEARDVVGLIRALGIDYEEAAMPAGDSGKIIRSGPGEYRIVVNRNEGPQRKRFTAAHELGHYLLHRHKLGVGEHLDRLFDEARNRNEANPLDYKDEVQANRFAADVLMPRKVIEKYAAPNGSNYAELAQRFDVSRQAMKYRLINLGLRQPDPAG